MKAKQSWHRQVQIFTCLSGYGCLHEWTLCGGQSFTLYNSNPLMDGEVFDCGEAMMLICLRQRDLTKIRSDLIWSRGMIWNKKIRKFRKDMFLIFFALLYLSISLDLNCTSLFFVVILHFLIVNIFPLLYCYYYVTFNCPSIWNVLYKYTNDF